MKGLAQDTLTDPNQDLPEKIAIMILDTDYYVPTRVQLEVLFPRLVIGAFLFIDDYCLWDGMIATVDEFLAKYSNNITMKLMQKRKQ